MKKITQCIVLVFLLLQLALFAGAQQTAQKFVQETQYLLSLPQGYTNDTTQRWPLILFLHGSGESGTDVQKVKVHGPPKLAEQGKNLPFIIISPQATNGWKEDQLYALLQSVKKNYRVDNDRVYLTGLSMGGYGTWALASAYPDEFAAIAPICGGGDSSKVWKLRNMPVWCFHGAKDNVVPQSESDRMVNALKGYNPSVKYTVYPEANHDSWTETYNNEELYTWFLAQKKFRYKKLALDKKTLQQYTGRFTGPRNDTLTLAVKGDSLVVKAGNDNITLHPAGGDVFFFHEDSQEMVRFLKDKLGKVIRFDFMGNRKEIFRKIK